MSKLFSKAKALRRKHPHKYKKWTDYVKAAARSERSPRKKTKTVRRKKTVVRKKRSAAPRKSVKGLQHYLSKAKDTILNQIASAEKNKFVARTKRAKKKIAKRITSLKSKYRKLQ